MFVATTVRIRSGKSKLKAYSGLSDGSHPSNASWQYVHVAISSYSKVGVYFQPASTICSSRQLYLTAHLKAWPTCLVLHFHPFLFSCGHLLPNVAFLASIIRVLEGYSKLNSPSCFSIVATMAHPQSGECFKCSASGSSPFSHPSRDLWQRKHAALSGLVCVG
jgi:hypothetical protein